MVIPSLIDEFYREAEVLALESIHSFQESIGLMAEIREQKHDDWEIEELTRAIMFDEAQKIESLREEIELARTARKKLERV